MGAAYNVGKKISKGFSFITRSSIALKQSNSTIITLIKAEVAANVFKKDMVYILYKGDLFEKGIYQAADYPWDDS